MSSFDQPVEEVRLQSDGFKVLRDGKLEFHLKWEDILGIAAFKQDLFSIDLICIGFQTAHDLSYPYVHEQMVGYKAFLNEMAHRFPVQNSEWRSRVALPPFQTRWTVIWGDAPELLACVKCGYDLRGNADHRCPECGYALPPGTCPECGGRGRILSVLFLKIGVIGIGVGTVLFAAGHFLKFGFLTTIGLTVFVMSAIAAFVNLIDLHPRCQRCTGTGREPQESKDSSPAHPVPMNTDDQPPENLED